MAITGTFAADFSAFQSAVTEAEVRLRTFESSSNRVASSLSRMTDSFSGRRVIQDATLMTEAIDRVGGISKLTEAELRRVGATAAEAAAKLKAMGVEVPVGLQKIVDQTKALNTEQSALIGTLKSVAGAFGIAFSVQQVIAFGRHVFDTASQIKDMAQALDVSTEAAQRFVYAAQQGGGTFEDVERAIGTMNRVLAEGDKSTVNALRDLGLEFQAIRSQRPEQAFAAIVSAAKDVADPMVQARATTELFGKSTLALLPSIREGFVELGQGAKIMRDDTIESLERAQQAWQNFFNRITIISGEALGRVTKAVDDLNARWSEMSFLDKLKEAGPTGALMLELARAMGLVSESTKKVAGDIPLVPPQLQRTKEELAAAEQAARRFAEAEANIASLMAGPEGISGAVAEAITYFLELGASQSDLAAYFGVTAGAVASVKEAMDLAKESAKILSDTTETMWKRSLELNKENNEELKRTSQIYLEIANNAVIANLKAKEALAAKQGLDLQGNRLPPPGSMEAAQADYGRKLRELRANAPAGIDTSASEALLYQEFVEAFDKAAQAANGLAAAHTGTAAAGDQANAGLTRFGGSAVNWADVLYGSATQFAGSMASAARTLEARMTDTLSTLRQYSNAGAPTQYIYPPGYTPPHRAMGGAVQAGQSYWVGEKGPELFTPGASGNITPNGAVAGPTVQVNVSGILLTNDPSARAQLASVIDDAIMRTLRQQGRRFGTT